MASPRQMHTARPDGYIDYFNKRWLEYFGLTLGEVAGWNWTAVVHAEDVEGILTRWRACLVTGEIFIDSVMQRLHPQDRADFQTVIDGASRGGEGFRAYLSFAAV